MPTRRRPPVVEADPDGGTRPRPPGLVAGSGCSTSMEDGAAAGAEGGCSTSMEDGATAGGVELKRVEPVAWLVGQCTISETSSRRKSRED